MSTRPQSWDRIVDVAIVGSGAAGLSAATLAHDEGAEVLVLEKAGQIGGTTAVSAGMPWIPVNRHMKEAGILDTRQEALRYLRRLTGGHEPDPDLLEVYVNSAAEMLHYLETNTPVRTSAPLFFSDYYATLPGGKPGGRSLEPVPFDARTELGVQAERVRTGPHAPRFTIQEAGKFEFERLGEPPDLEVAARREKEDVRVLGSALVAALFKGLVDRGVEVLTSTPALELVVADGAVIGVVARHDDVEIRIGARRGVVLASGGFEWNRDFVLAFIGEEITPMGPPQNEGDGLRMAMQVGAELANMTSLWGSPGIAQPGLEIDGQAVVQWAALRSAPGVIIVNSRGERFVNEGMCYHDFPKVMRTYDPFAVDYPNRPPVWLMFDQDVVDRSPTLNERMGGASSEVVVRAEDLRELAARTDIDSDRLSATVARWNDHVAQGEDPDFHRGTLWYEAFMSGGPSPEACLAPVAQPPFYAMKLYNSTIGTNGGPRIDANGRVCRLGGGVISGLYAAGNVSASAFGPAYPGGGATIGLALTFGYLAGRHVGGEPARQIEA